MREHEVAQLARSMVEYSVTSDCDVVPTISDDSV